MAEPSGRRLGISMPVNRLCIDACTPDRSSRRGLGVKQQAADWEQDGCVTSRACLAYVITTREEAIAVFWNLTTQLITGSGRVARQKPAVPSSPRSAYERHAPNGTTKPQRQNVRRSLTASRRRVWSGGGKVRLSSVPGSIAAYYPRHPQASLASGQHHARVLANWRSSALASLWHFPPINETRVLGRRRGRAHLRRINIIAQLCPAVSVPSIASSCAGLGLVVSELTNVAVLAQCLLRLRRLQRT